MFKQFFRLYSAQRTKSGVQWLAQWATALCVLLQPSADGTPLRHSSLPIFPPLPTHLSEAATTHLSEAATTHLSEAATTHLSETALSNWQFPEYLSHQREPSVTRRRARTLVLPLVLPLNSLYKDQCMTSTVYPYFCISVVFIIT